MRRSGRYVALVPAALAVVACSDPTSTVRDQLNLDRPVDVAFACHGGLRLSGGDAGEPTDPVIVSAQPAEACAIASLDPDLGVSNVPLGQEVLSTGADPALVQGYGFILQSVPGTIAIAAFPNKPAASFRSGDVLVLDADALIPGKNGITVGSLPVAIATDTLGCHVATANAGSCDLSVLSINSLLRYDTAPEINRVAVVDGNGVPVLAKPAAMLAQPPSGTIGVECPATPQGVFYVAYPGCHVVAAVQGDGTIAEAIQFAADGTASIVPGTAVSCPAECGDPRGVATTGPHPVALDLVTDPLSGVRRMVIGAEDDNVLTIVELDETTQRFESVSQIALEGEIGVVDVALSPEIGMGGSQGDREPIGPGGQFQFVYAVATDGSVRVADVLAQNRECDTQIDPRYLNAENNIGELSCLPVGDPSRPRRPNVRGPGIQLLGDSVAISVRIFWADRTDPGIAASPNLLVGYFAAIGTSAGGVVIANVDDDFYADTEDSSSPLAAAIPLAIAHQLRDSIPERDLLASTTIAGGIQVPICDTDGPPSDDPELDRGGPRLAEPPVRFINTAFISPAKSDALPSLRSLRCEGDDATMPVSELGFAAPPGVREAAYPDLRAVRKAEPWTLVWEGALSRDGATNDIDGPPIRLGRFQVDGTGMRIEDPSRPFCAIGVEPHDIVAMRGCDPSLGDAECPTAYSCYVHPDALVAAGSCLPTDQIDALSGPCREFLISTRRYSVATADSGGLKLAERPRVLRTTPITGCIDTAQCDNLYVAEHRLRSDADPIDDTTTPAPRAFACEPEPSRGGVNRCVMTCDPAGDSSDCDPGNVCNARGRCVEGLVPPLQCVTSLQRYEMRASDAFAVVGGVAGYQHSIIEDAGGHCVKDPSPSANPLLVGRIPLTAPACVGGPTDLVPLGPNPCATTVDHTYLQARYQAGTCAPADPVEELVTVPTPAIRFRNPQLTYHLVQPTYPGDAVCNGDRMGGLVDVPVTFPGLTIEFEQVDGLVPRSVGVPATFPVRVVLGPQHSLWIVDEGDFLSTSSSTASTRGKVFRVESVDLSNVNTLQ